MKEQAGTKIVPTKYSGKREQKHAEETKNGNGNEKEVWQREREKKELKDKRKEQNRPAEEQAGTKKVTKREQTLVQCK
jgi:hypothetical protein